mgnify:CR=1 FL=1
MLSELGKKLKKNKMKKVIREEKKIRRSEKSKCIKDMICTKKYKIGFKSLRIVLIRTDLRISICQHL